MWASAIIQIKITTESVIIATEFAMVLMRVEQTVPMRLLIDTTIMGAPTIIHKTMAPEAITAEAITLAAAIMDITDNRSADLA